MTILGIRPESGSPILDQVFPESVDLKTPIPTETSLRMNVSPVPAQMTFELRGSTAKAVMASDARGLAAKRVLVQSFHVYA